MKRLRGLIERFEAAAKEQKLLLPLLVLYPDGANDLVYDTVSQEWVTQPELSVGTLASAPKAWHQELSEIVAEVRCRDTWQGMLVGGCCKTRPAHIAALRESVDMLGS